MSHRFLISVASMGALAMVIAVVFLAPAPTVAQSATAAAETRTPLRTPWGDPDLQGVWVASTLTPLERAEKYAGREFLTREEVAVLEKAAAEGQFDGDEVDPRTGKFTAQGGVGTYNPQWFDRGIKWVPSRRTSLIVDPRDGRIPWTRDGQKGQREYGAGPYDSYIDLDTGERCLSDGMSMIWFGYNPNHQIVQTPDHVVILHEMFGQRRVIPLKRRTHVSENIRQWQGDPRGRWEGDTLVVESTHFTDAPHNRYANVWRGPSKTLHVVERFTRADAHTINYRATITDPSKFARPWTVEMPLTTKRAEAGVTEGPLFENACHEGNYGALNILSGARARDRRPSEKAPGPR